MKITGLKKAIGEFKRANAGGYYSVNMQNVKEFIAENFGG